MNVKFKIFNRRYFSNKLQLQKVSIIPMFTNNIWTLETIIA